MNRICALGWIACGVLNFIYGVGGFCFATGLEMLAEGVADKNLLFIVPGFLRATVGAAFFTGISLACFFWGLYSINSELEQTESA